MPDEVNAHAAEARRNPVENVHFFFFFLGCMFAVLAVIATLNVINNLDDIKTAWGVADPSFSDYVTEIGRSAGGFMAAAVVCAGMGFIFPSTSLPESGLPSRDAQSS